MQLSNIPPQKLPMSKKDEEWGKAVINELEKLVYANIHNQRPYRYQKQVNFDLFNGKFNLKDLEYVTKPYGINNEFPATLNHYDVISPKIMLLLGEESKRPFNFRIYAENSEAVTDIEEKRQEMLMQYLQSEIIKENPEQQPEITPDKINRYIKYTYQDIYSKTAQEALNILIRDQNVVNLFNKGWKDALVAGEEIYWTGIVNGEPVMRLCNPMDISVVLDPDSDFIDDAQVIAEERWLTLGSVMDEFYDVLKPKDIDNLEKGLFRSDSTGVANNLTVQSFTVLPVNGEQPVNSYTRPYRDINGNIRVVRVEWKSLKKIGFLTYVDENGTQQEMMVDENYKIDKELGESVEWFWINEYWEGTKIGSNIYVNIQPKKNQRRRMDNPTRCKSGYCGAIYNNRNSQGVSLVDRVKPFQYLYNIIFYRLELALAKSKGKALLMDVAQIPTSEDWDVDKWLYYLDALGIAFINSNEEGKEGSRKGMTSNFNQFQSIDLTMGNDINQCVLLLDKIKAEIGELCGVSPQRQGQIQSNELVGNSERAVVQSSHITEYWFHTHNEVKRRVLTGLLDAAKIAWREGKKIQYITDDMGKSFFDLDGELFEMGEYGIFVGNSAKDDRVMEGLKQLAQAALQNDKATLSDMISILKSDSITDVEHRMIEAEDQRNKMAEQARKEELQAQQQAIAAKQQDEAARMEFEANENELDRQNKIDIALISAENKETTESPTEEKENNDIQLKEMEHASKLKQIQTQLGLTNSHDAREREKDRQLERELQAKEAAAKIALEKSKPKPKPTSKK